MLAQMKKQSKNKLSFEQLCDLWFALEKELCVNPSDLSEFDSWRLNFAFTTCLANFSWTVKEWNDAVAKQKARKQVVKQDDS